jgi:uncharacterized RDD family membrane protein YckC
MLSYYEILGIDVNASDEEIQAAYDDLLKQCYANLRNPKTHDESVEKIKQITLARNFLLDSELRKKYDTDATMEEIEKNAPLDPRRRFFARCFDQLIFFAIFYLVYRYYANYVFFEDRMLALVFAVVGIVLYFLLETAVIAVFGSTLGKWMLSIGITATDGQKPKRIQLIKRNLMVALFGLGFDIPPFVFIAMIMQYRKLKKAGNESLTSWDRAYGAAVNSAQIKAYRLLLIIPAMVLVIICLVNAFM